MILCNDCCTCEKLRLDVLNNRLRLSDLAAAQIDNLICYESSMLLRDSNYDTSFLQMCLENRPDDESPDNFLASGETAAGQIGSAFLDSIFQEVGWNGETAPVAAAAATESAVSSSDAVSDSAAQSGVIVAPPRSRRRNNKKMLIACAITAVIVTFLCVTFAIGQKSMFNGFQGRGVVSSSRQYPSFEIACEQEGLSPIQPDWLPDSYSLDLLMCLDSSAGMTMLAKYVSGAELFSYSLRVSAEEIRAFRENLDEPGFINYGNIFLVYSMDDDMLYANTAIGSYAYTFSCTDTDLFYSILDQIEAYAGEEVAK